MLVVACVWINLAALSWKDSASQDAENAIELYNDNKLDEALAKITSAQVGMPNSPKLQFNMGNVLYRKGQFEDARAGYKVASQDVQSSVSQSAIYNTGNASLKAGDINGAIDAYTQALLLNPDDVEARYNLELALRAQRQKQNEKQQDMDKKHKQSQEDQSQQEDKQAKQQKSEKPKEQEGKQAEQKEGEQGQEKRQKPQQLTKDQIQQILAALRQQEQQVEKKLHRAKSSSSSVEKNW